MEVFNKAKHNDWKKKYILEYNKMRDNYEDEIKDLKNQLYEIRELYEDKLHKRELEISKLKSEISILKDYTRNLKPRDKQISDDDIELIRTLRKEGASYREIEKATKWSKATVCRVLNGLYD